MSYAARRADSLDYAPCRYGASKLVFRGPKKTTDGAYITVFGGTETYGRFVARPFPDLVEDALGVPVLNLGCQNAGIDAFLYDTEVASLANGAQLTILQVMGAPNMSNRFYRVHPRRNDRFLGPSDALKGLYRDVDFTDFSFTKHMLSTLNRVSSSRFCVLRRELKEAWIARMKLLLQKIDGPVVLLWMREEASKGLGCEPLFVGADMIAALKHQVLDVVEVPVRRAGGDLGGMIYGSMELPVASEMYSVPTHQEIAQALLPIAEAHL